MTRSLRPGTSIWEIHSLAELFCWAAVPSLSRAVFCSAATKRDVSASTPPLLRVSIVGGGEGDGKSVESAVASHVAFENACQAQLLAQAAGTIKLIGHEVARHTANQTFGADPGAWGFRPLWERVLREQPDFLE